MSIDKSAHILLAVFVYQMRNSFTVRLRHDGCIMHPACPFLTFKGGRPTLWILNEENDTIHTHTHTHKKPVWWKKTIRTGGNLRTFKKNPHCSTSLCSMVNEPCKTTHFRGGRILLQYGRGVSSSVDYDDNITSNAGVKLIWTTIWGQNELGWAKKYTNPELYLPIFQL